MSIMKSFEGTMRETIVRTFFTNKIMELNPYSYREMAANVLASQDYLMHIPARPGFARDSNFNEAIKIITKKMNELSRIVRGTSNVRS